LPIKKSELAAWLADLSTLLAFEQRVFVPRLFVSSCLSLIESAKWQAKRFLLYAHGQPAMATWALVTHTLRGPHKTCPVAVTAHRNKAATHWGTWRKIPRKWLPVHIRFLIRIGLIWMQSFKVKYMLEDMIESQQDKSIQKEGTIFIQFYICLLKVLILNI